MSGENDSHAAFGRLYDDHFGAIFRYVLLRVGRVAEAEELTSQTFFKALRGFRRWRPTAAPVSAWLYRIAANEVNSHFRRRRRQDRWESTEVADADSVARESESAEARLQRCELCEQLARAIHALPEQDQTLVILRYVEQQPYSEIARVLRTRKGTLAMRAHRALKRLRAELEKRGVNHGRVEESPARRGVVGSSCDGVPADAAP